MLRRAIFFPRIIKSTFYKIVLYKVFKPISIICLKTLKKGHAPKIRKQIVKLVKHKVDLVVNQIIRFFPANILNSKKGTWFR